MASDGDRMMSLNAQETEVIPLITRQIPLTQSSSEYGSIGSATVEVNNLYSIQGNELDVVSKKIPSWVDTSDAKGNVVGIAFTLFQTCVGAGLLQFPFAFKSLGIVMGCVVTLFVAIISWYTLIMIIRCCDSVQEFDFKGVSSAIFGKYSGPVFEVFVFFVCFGSATVYIILLGQMLPTLFLSWIGPGNFLSNKYSFTAILLTFFIFPLCLLRNIEALSSISILSVLSSLFATLVVIVKFITEAALGNVNLTGIRLISDDFFEFFGAFPILFLSFGCHLTVMPLYKSLKNRTMFKMSIPVSAAVGIVASLYTVLGLFGYLLFKEKTRDNFLLNFAANELLATICKFTFTLQLVVSLCVLHFVCRNGIESVFYGKNVSFSWARWILIAIIQLALMYGIASVFEHVTTVFGLTGAIAGVLVFYVFPAILYFKVETSLWKRLPVLLLVAVAVILGSLGTVANVRNLILKFRPNPSYSSQN